MYENIIGDQKRKSKLKSKVRHYFAFTAAAAKVTRMAKIKNNVNTKDKDIEQL